MRPGTERKLDAKEDLEMPKRTILMSSLVVAMLLLGPLPAAFAGANADSEVRVLPSGPWVGSGIVQSDATTQTLATKIGRGKSKMFEVCIAQDAGADTAVGITSKGDQGKLLASWTDELDSSKVSDAEIASGYSRTVGAFDSLCLKLKIKVAATAKVHASKTWEFLGDLISYVGDTDTAAIQVTVRK